MDFRRYKDILALKTEENRFIGFHSRNLAVAEISTELWQALEKSPALPPDIHDELEAWNNEIDAQATDVNSFDKIRSLSLNIAQICNLGCTYCAAGGDGTYGSDVTKIDSTKAEVQIQYFLGLAKPGEHFQIEFLGGEPLLYPQVIESLCRYAHLCAAGQDIQLDFVITTNGTLITDEVAQMFARHQFAVTISLDGPPEINDLVRPSKSTAKSSTAMTLDGLKKLIPVREKLRALNVNCVFGVHNTAVVDAYTFLTLLEMNWDLINLNFANSIEQNNELGQAAESRATEMYLSEIHELADHVFARTGLDGLAKIAQFRRPLTRLASQSRINSYCAAGKSLVLADTRADLYVCNWFMNDKEEKIGHLTTIDETKWKAYAPELIELNKCETCWARHLCGGGCMAVHKGFSGSKHEKNPNFCARTREIAALAVKYYTESNIE
jgi:uncharacterized protein